MSFVKEPLGDRDINFIFEGSNLFLENKYDYVLKQKMNDF